MRAAPPVEMPLAHGRAERLGMVVLHGAAGAALGTWLAGWCMSGLSLRWQAALVLGLAAVLAGLGAWHCRRLLPPQGRILRWTGEAWMVCPGSTDLHGSRDPDRSPVTSVAVLPAGEPPQVLHELQLQLDLGDWLLLRWRTDDRRTHWAVASRGQAVQAWHPMSVALRAHTGRMGPQKGGNGRTPTGTA